MKARSVGPGSAAQRQEAPHRIRDTIRGVYPTIRSRPTQKPAFSTFLSTLPTPVIGNSLTNFTCLGACAEPLRAFTRLIARARPRSCRGSRSPGCIHQQSLSADGWKGVERVGHAF